MLPTPYGEVAEQWWYYTRAFLSLEWNGQDLTLEEVPDILNSCLAALLRELMFPSMTIDMETLVTRGNTRRRMGTDRVSVVRDDDDQSDLTWDDFTLVHSPPPPL
jgi:hypothetical protein